MVFPILDVLVAMVLIIFILVGIYKGFWRSLISMFSVLVTLILAILLAKPLSMLFQNWFHFSSALGNSFHGGVESYVNANGTGGWLGQAMNIIMGKDYMANVSDNATLVNDFSFKLGQICNILICAVVLYILIRIGLWLMSKLLKKITENEIANGVDKGLGAVFGLIKGAVSIFVLMALIFELSSFIMPVGDWFNNMLEHNKFTSLLYGWSKDIMQNVIVPFFVK
ncbi:MAG: CvpA family protein [Clostridia bacterium]|nr:CvpA family protein [Clostridia bacterium]